MSKTVQITQELFFQLCRHHLMDCHDNQDAITQALNDKLDALVQRDLYTKYKTAPTQEQRDQARKNYLDKRNIPEDYRW